MQELQILAAQGDARAQNELASFYRRGRGVTLDPAEAARLGPAAGHGEAAAWLRKAAEQNHPLALGDLGVAYLKGFGMAKDEQQALLWLRRAAARGNPNSQNNLGTLYETGAGMEKDFRTGFVWYQTAARHGDAGGQRNLARMFQDGTLFPPDLRIAYAWLSLAARQDRQAAAEKLAVGQQLTEPQRAEASLWAAQWKPGAVIQTEVVDAPSPAASRVEFRAGPTVSP
ncbi:MAG: tetratricopeptide repeat protein [Caldimonas sp.]